MASKKQQRYGQGGFKHKHTPNLDRPNGKAWKQHPKAFDIGTRGLMTTNQACKGKTFLFV